MKFCTHCGKEIFDEAVSCPGCGCAGEQQKQISKQTYENIIRNAGAFVAISVVLLVLGVVAGLFISVLLGAVLCLVAEIVAMMPKTKVQELFMKNNSHITDKKQLKAEIKKLGKELKKKNSAYAATFVITIIALIGVIAFALMI